MGEVYYDPESSDLTVFIVDGVVLMSMRNLIHSNSAYAHQLDGPEGRRCP